MTKQSRYLPASLGRRVGLRPPRETWMALFVMLFMSSVSYAEMPSNASVKLQQLMQNFLQNPSSNAYHTLGPEINAALNDGGRVPPSQLQALAGSIQGQNPGSIQLGVDLLELTDPNTANYLSNSLGNAASSNPQNFMNSLSGASLSDVQLDRLTQSLPQNLSFNGVNLQQHFQQLSGGILDQWIAQFDQLYFKYKAKWDRFLIQAKRQLNSIL